MSETVVGQMVQFKNVFEIVKDKIGEKYLFVHQKPQQRSLLVEQVHGLPRSSVSST
jgi:hypothetical protein